MKILLADDSVTAQNMGKKILAEAGHEVVCVSNGAAALKKVAEQEPDLVILDIYMPGYSGVEVCQRLKEAPSTAAIPVVLTVGKLEPFRKEDAQRVRAEALIVKPFEASELAAAVARFANFAPPKTGKTVKDKAKPAPPPKPQWDEVSEDDFITTSQREMEKDEAEVPSPVEKSPAFSDQPEEAAQPPTILEAKEFEVSQAPLESAAAPPASEGASFGGASSPQGAESNWPAPVIHEFSVEADSVPVSESPSQVAAAKAAAAAAGAASGTIGDKFAAEFSQDNPPRQSPVAPATEPTREKSFLDQFASQPDGFEMSTAVAPQLSAAAPEAFAASAPDPAFEPDRTQWATHFATRYGLPEEEEKVQEPETLAPAEEKTEPPASPAVSKSEPSTAADEITAILSTLPGGFAGSEESAGGGEGSQFGERPWPTESVSPGPGDWKAEEVPVEDQESSISLAEEMERTSATEAPAQPGGAGHEAPEATAMLLAPAASQDQATEAPAAPEGKVAETQPASNPFRQEPGAAESEIKPAQTMPDPIAGVMQSAAMAIATRATVSAVTSQLHTQPPAAEGDNVTAPSSIEDLVSNVLERLKPKLIAEIKRELGASEEK